jgi:esterase/lipase
MNLNIEFLKDIQTFENTSLNIKSALTKLNKPYLIIHGDQDLTVPVNEAEDLFSWSNKSLTELSKIKGSGHTFDVTHPFEISTKALNLVLEQTDKFFQKHLQS